MQQKIHNTHTISLIIIIQYWRMVNFISISHTCVYKLKKLSTSFKLFVFIKRHRNFVRNMDSDVCTPSCKPNAKFPQRKGVFLIFRVCVCIFSIVYRPRLYWTELLDSSRLLWPIIILYPFYVLFAMANYTLSKLLLRSLNSATID